MGSYYKWEFKNGIDSQRNQLYVKAKPVQKWINSVAYYNY